MLYFTRWKALGIILLALVVCLCAVPNFFPEATVKGWPLWAQRRLVLGLDLQGGSYLLLEVDSNYVKKEKLDQVSDAGSGVIRLSVPQAAITERIRQTIEQSIQIVEKRVNQLGTVEPLIQRQGTDRILVQVPGLQDPTQLKTILGKTAKMEFRMVDTSVPADQAQRGNLPPDVEVLMSASAPKVPYVVKKQVLVS